MENKNIEIVEPKHGGIKETILSRRNKKYSLTGTKTFVIWNNLETYEQRTHSLRRIKPFGKWNKLEAYKIWTEWNKKLPLMEQIMTIKGIKKQPSKKITHEKQNYKPIGTKHTISGTNYEYKGEKSLDQT
jgi:hypothetical protein